MYANFIYLISDERGSTVAEAGLLTGFVAITLMSFANALADRTSDLFERASVALNEEYAQPSRTSVADGVDIYKSETREIPREPLQSTAQLPAYDISGRAPQSSLSVQPAAAD